MNEIRDTPTGRQRRRKMLLAVARLLRRPEFALEVVRLTIQRLMLAPRGRQTVERSSHLPRAASPRVMG